MKPKTPRLRMFAGPNGSGKSCFNNILPPELKGVYLNADELEKQLEQNQSLDLSQFQLCGKAEELWQFAARSPIHSKRNLRPKCSIDTPDQLTFPPEQIDSYLASSLIESMRVLLLEAQTSFTFETVMSHVSKVKFLRQAREKGYRTYLYYIATEDPEINVSRVANRVIKGGHPVPEDKIRSRYQRSLELLYSAIKETNRAYLFDNSSDGTAHSWIAEATDGSELSLKVAEVPNWFHEFVFLKSLRP
ncbi:zeta toxin family protein [Roseibacillus persicicus]|uniref:zeta toxin family protein n=1 Tax=Roseibacillus persicicus TaxID=454148 RepID=UPI00280E0572|nr:zeta toxin family protein [Roseibacillus persicicus]MDQ8192526.1 zeta toxin family protein [Roseibacillus persicicus]